MPAALDDILEIPGNRPVFQDLQRLLAAKKALAFVGAGASAGMYPLWGEFIGRLADYAVDQGKAEPKDRDRWKADRTATPQQRVNTILRKLGEDPYRQFLRETFAPRAGGDGKRYTPIHATLLRLPFRGYVTTNYDPALEFARMELRPGCLTTGTPTWQDDEEIHRWLTGDVFEPGDACPILWLHGYWQRPAGIVLNAGEYAAAYRPGLYRKTFQRLWEQDHLVFAGFGFNDPQFTFMVGEILRDLAGAHALPRHIAILSVPLDTDPESIQEGRANLEADYHVRPLYYRVSGQDHSELFVLLEGLAGAGSRPEPAPSPPPATQTIPSQWVHETSNDDKFTGREDERARLDRWVADPAVRAIGITAVGGTGKTALVGHWLKSTDGWRSRPFEGLFAWSFYQERASTVFLRTLLTWAHETFGTPNPDDRTDLVHTALKLLRSHTLLIVLDGLEVLQEGPEQSRYGAFLDGTLRELLVGLCTQRTESLAVLTSRFVFANLERHLGTAFHQLELPGLAPDQGAELLAELEVRGSAADRENVSRRLEGHPLGLRVFAEALPEPQRDHPQRFLAEAFRTLSSDSPLAKKVQRLLVFYQEKLPLIQARLLGVVALFRSPVAEETILQLVRGLFGRKRKQPLPDDATLGLELKRLHARGVLTHEPIDGGRGYACHPILRDHFRAVLLDQGAATARRAADLLRGQPSEEQPRSAKDIEPVLLAIEVLLDAGDLGAADALYRDRLENGRLFMKLPALPEGLRCALGFVLDEPRRQKCGELSRVRLRYYLNEVGLFASLSGDHDLAARFYSDSNALLREMKSVGPLSVGLQNEADLYISLGDLAKAADRIAEALILALKCDFGFERQIGFSNAYYGWVRGLSGQLRAAAEGFAVANTLEKKNDSDGAELYGLRGTRWAELLVRTGHSNLAARRTAANLRICDRQLFYIDSAQCHWILGACALADGRLDDAEAELRQAESVFHRGQVLFELARLHVTAGSVALARRDAAPALQRAAEALALAQPRGMRLVHADALVLRGQVRLLETSADALSRALDDAEDALRLARDCGYAWAERDALALKADAHAALAKAAENDSAASRHRDAARRARTEAEALAARLRLTEEDLAEADAKAEAWMEEWEKQGKKKKERAG